MKHLFIVSALLVAIAEGGTTARGQDVVNYYNRTTKKKDTVTGNIKTESPGQIAIKPSAAAERTIPAIDVSDVEYNVPPLVKPDYRIAINAERRADEATKDDVRKKELAAALAKYQELVPKAADAKVKRHMEFKIARLMARQAEDDPAVIEPATEKLTQFQKAHRDSWQISFSSDLLAGLQMEKKDWAAAQKTYEDLIATPNISDEIRQDANLKIAQVLVRAKKYDAATSKLEELAKSVPADSPQAIRLQISLAECQAASGKTEEAAKKLEAILAKVEDPDLKAVAYNTLGDCQYQAKRLKEALYSYLWVDVIYHQNRQEHARALFHLVHVFKELKDDKRAQQYKEKLEGKEFAGLEYQKSVAAEK
jgi:predicted negative regulator of RcsB-dependent stress response